ncbi:MAG: 2-hydroxymuconate tautomerase [Pseudomonadota bacterium]
MHFSVTRTRTRTGLGRGGFSEPDRNQEMPTVHVYMMSGRTQTQKETLIRQVTDAVMTSVDAPEENVRVIISEVPKGDYGIGGTTGEKLGR